MIIPLLSRLATVAVVLTAVATAAALAARLHWFLELFSHFPVQYVVVLGLAAAIFIGLRRWSWALLALIVAVPSALAVAPYLPGTIRAPAPVAAMPVSLIALNLFYRREEAAATRAYLDRQSADLLVLSEVTPRWQQKLRELERSYPYSVIQPRLNPWGIAVYSKYPLQAVEDLDLGDDRSSHLRVLVQLPAGPAELYAVHLASPPGPRQAQQRNTQLRRLAEAIAAADPALPKIVAGDFNSTPFSPHFQDLLRDAGLRDARRSFGLQVTWPTWLWPMRIPIDHCLVSNAVTVTRVATGTPTGSDHFPVECAFSLAP